MQQETLFLHMRANFAKQVHAHMAKNNKIYVVVNDLGYKMWDNVRRDYPDRFINVGAAEQTMLGVGIGLALSNKIPIVYSITSFLLYRPFETIRNYLHHEKIPVKLIGSGRDKDYAHDGISHWAEEDKDIMKILHNIDAYWPEDVDEIPKMVNKMIKSNKPWYVNLKR
jgi:transketolase